MASNVWPCGLELPAGWTGRAALSGLECPHWVEWTCHTGTGRLKVSTQGGLDVPHWADQDVHTPWSGNAAPGGLKCPHWVDWTGRTWAERAASCGLECPQSCPGHWVDSLSRITLHFWYQYFVYGYSESPDEINKKSSPNDAKRLQNDSKIHPK